MTEWRGCTQPRCYRPLHCRGVCMRHYVQARYAGQLDALPTVQRPHAQARCTAAGCSRPAHGHGLCHKHLQVAS